MGDGWIAGWSLRLDGAERRAGNPRCGSVFDFHASWLDFGFAGFAGAPE